MKHNVYFYYDESAHSRKLTSKTFNDSRFRLDFVSTIIGISKDIFETFEKNYYDFEQKWKTHYSCEELKSTLIRSKKYKFGLASFKNEDADFYDDFFSILISNKVYLHFGVFNKIQYLMLQMLKKYVSSPAININSLSYSMAKALCVYRPKTVIDAIENNPNRFLPLFKEFLEKRRILNNRIHGESEEIAFSQMINILNAINNEIDLVWDYTFSFEGFKNYVNELRINSLFLKIDKEGSGKTKNCAIRNGINNVNEVDSKECFGVRCADLLSGFLSNMISSVQDATCYSENEVARNESLLDKKWFENIGEKKFKLYKEAYCVFYELNNSWYKYFCSSYSDGLITFLAVLKHFNEYENYSDYKTDGSNYHQHRVNSIVYWDLKNHNDELSGLFKVEPANIDGNGIMHNQKGAKVFIDPKHHKMIQLPEDGKELKYFILSMGFLRENDNPFSCPVATISEDGVPVCYLLPKEFHEIVMHFISLSVAGNNQFPSFASIKNNSGIYSLKLISK